MAETQSTGAGAVWWQQSGAVLDPNKNSAGHCWAGLGWAGLVWLGWLLGTHQQTFRAEAALRCALREQSGQQVYSWFIML